MKQLKNSVPSICIVSAYFGKNLPNSFDLWLESCRRNPSIDFLFFTDQPISSTAIAANVRIIPLTLEQIRQRASAVLGFAAVIDKGYH